MSCVVVVICDSEEKRNNPVVFAESVTPGNTGGKLSVATLIKMLFYHTFILDIAHGHIAASIIF